MMIIIGGGILGGIAAPFGVSAVLAALALVMAWVLVPETRPVLVSGQERVASRGHGRILASLPHPLYLFATLLVLDFIATFGFAFRLSWC